MQWFINLRYMIVSLREYKHLALIISFDINPIYQYIHGYIRSCYINKRNYRYFFQSFLYLSVLFLNVCRMTPLRQFTRHCFNLSKPLTCTLLCYYALENQRVLKRSFWSEPLLNTLQIVLIYFHSLINFHCSDSSSAVN